MEITRLNRIVFCWLRLIMTAPTKELKMKSSRIKDYGKNKSVASGASREVQTPEARRRQHQQDKEFIRAMNEFTAKAGLLSDDPFFGGI
jgi:antitoxin CcdA